MGLFSSIGHCVSSAAKTVGHGIEKATDSVASGVKTTAKATYNGVVKPVGNYVVKHAKDIGKVAKYVGYAGDVLNAIPIVGETGIGEALTGAATGVQRGMQGIQAAKAA